MPSFVDQRPAGVLRSELSASLGLLDEAQDWGITNAAGERLEEFSGFVNTKDLAPTQVFDMVELVLASANERLIVEPPAGLQAVHAVLEAHPSAATVHCDYWASLEDPIRFSLGVWLGRERRPGQRGQVADAGAPPRRSPG